MGAFIIRRLLIAIPVLLGITMISFLALSLAPGDPLTARMDPSLLAALQRNPAELDARRQALGLDDPLPIRYAIWLEGALTGDFGYSIQSHRPIADEISQRIPVTLALMGTAIALALIIGIPFGIASALRQYSKLDYTLTTFTMLMSSTPSFVLGLAFIYIFAVGLRLLPGGGMETLGGNGDTLDFIRHLILPASVLGLGAAAPLLRYTRAAMLEVMNSDYVVTARSKGLTPPVVIMRHAFRNSLIPIITVVGLLLPDLVAGAVITEQIFSWPGMGQLAVQAASNRDPALMMGVVLVVGPAVVLTNLAVDVLYARIDPRIRFGSAH